jgi:hypothetical protein
LHGTASLILVPALRMTACCRRAFWEGANSIECPNIDNEWGVPVQIFYGISDNARKFWGIANARRVIGYEPQDDSEVKYSRDIAAFLMHEM